MPINLCSVILMLINDIFSDFVTVVNNGSFMHFKSYLSVFSIVIVIITALSTNNCRYGVSGCILQDPLCV